MALAATSISKLLLFAAGPYRISSLQPPYHTEGSVQDDPLRSRSSLGIPNPQDEGAAPDALQAQVCL